MKTYGGGEITPRRPIFNFGLRTEVSQAHALAILPPGRELLWWFRRRNNFLPQQGLEPRFLGRPVRSLVTKLTELFSQLKLFRIVNTILSVLFSSNFQHPVHNNSPLVSLASSMNPILKLHHIYLRYILILSTNFPSNICPFTSPPKILCTFIFAYMRAICPAHLLNFVIILINRQKYIQLVLSLQTVSFTPMLILAISSKLLPSRIFSSLVLRDWTRMEIDAVLSAVRVPMFQRNLLPRSPSTRLQAAFSSENLVDFYHFRGRHISDVCNVQNDGSDNLR
jgi:hypothetical protein